MKKGEPDVEQGLPPELLAWPCNHSPTNGEGGTPVDKQISRLRAPFAFERIPWYDGTNLTTLFCPTCPTPHHLGSVLDRRGTRCP